MKSVRGILLAALLPALSACHVFGMNSCHRPQAYLGAHSVAPLKIPAGLDAPETNNALRIPALNEPAPPARKGLIGEVAERSKALDWNSSNISTGVRGFESHPLRHLTARSGVTMVARIGFSATTSRESRQGRKAAAAAAMSGAGA